MTMLTSQKIADFVIEALERTAFVLAEAIDAGQATSLPAPSKYSRISYIGPTSGNVYLAASEGFIRELAASILGVEPEDVDPSNEGEDAITELAISLVDLRSLNWEAKNANTHFVFLN